MKTKKLLILTSLAVIAMLISSCVFTSCKISLKENDGAVSAASDNTGSSSPESIKDQEEAVRSIPENGPDSGASTPVSENKGIAGFYDDEAGFKMNYPSDAVVFSNNYFVNTTGTDIVLVVQVKKISDLSSDEALGYDKETSLKDETALKEGTYGEDVDFAYGPSKKVVKIKDIYAKEFIVFGRYEACDSVFEKHLIFYNNGYQVIITLIADKDGVIESMPEYFAAGTENCGETMAWKMQEGKNSQDDFYDALQAGAVSERVKTWLNSYSYIAENIQVNEAIDLTGGEIVFSTVKDINSDIALNYDILNLYPQFSSGNKISTGSLSVLNSAIKELTEVQKEQFKKYIEELGDPDPSDDRGFTNTFQGDYSVSIPGNSLVSLIYAVYSYTGGAHGAFTEFSFNYDTAAGKEIMLPDLFKPEFDYLKFISDFSINDLKSQMLEMGGSYDEKWLENGAGPDANNYKTFTLSKDYLVIKFAQYQVAPYAFGTFNVKIPYTDFRGDINPESVLTAYLD